MIPIIKNRIYTIDVQIKLKEKEESSQADYPPYAHYYPWWVDITSVCIAWGYELHESIYCTGESISQLLLFVAKNKLVLAAEDIYSTWLNLYYHYELSFNFKEDIGVIIQAYNNTLTEYNLYSFYHHQNTQCEWIEDCKDYLKRHKKIYSKNWQLFVHLCPLEMQIKYSKRNATHLLKILVERDSFIKSDISSYMELFVTEVKITINQFLKGILLKNKERFYPILNLKGTISGRLTSKGKTILNAPLSAKECGEDFICEEGTSILRIDFNQIEPTILAYLSQDKNLLYCIQDGINQLPIIENNNLKIGDIYLSVAYRFREHRKEIMENLDFTSPNIPKDKLKEVRDFAKQIVNMMHYSAGPKLIKERLSERFNKEFSFIEIDEFCSQYKLFAKDAFSFKDRIEKEVIKKGYLINIGGFPLTFKENDFYKSLSLLLQSSASVCLKMLNYHMYNEFKNNSFFEYIFCNFHDGCFIQVDNNYIEYVKELIDGPLLTEVRKATSLPLTLTIRKGNSFYETF